LSICSLCPGFSWSEASRNYHRWKIRRPSVVLTLSAPTRYWHSACQFGTIPQRANLAPALGVPTLHQ